MALQSLKRVTDFLIFSNIFVSLCAASLVSATKIILQVSTGFYLETFVFFSSLAVYNFQRIVLPDTKEIFFLSIRHKWIRRNRKLLSFLTAISVIISAFIFLFYFNSQIKSIILLLPFVLITFWYALDIQQILPFLKRKFKKLRTIPYLKILLIAITWTAITVWLPIVEYKIDVSTVYLLIMSTERVLFIFAITLPFDIRDMKQDKVLNVKTIPLILGIERTKFLSYVSLLIFSLIAFSRLSLVSSDLAIVAALIISALITGFLISFLREEKGEYYYSFWIESTMIIQFLLLFLVTLI